MELTHRLLDHPFYQAWTHGKISPDQLARYARAYAEFIAEMPRYWQRIGAGLGADTSAVAREEQEHVGLWDQWASRLPAPSRAQRLDGLLAALEDMTPSELLGAIHAFEIQQPEVARTKKDGLLKHYGFAAQDTVYFDAHEAEDEHIALGETLASRLAKPAEFRAGFARGAEAVYHSLDGFVN